MNKIRVMSELLANKIAAGEVVEKCVSVVKELVENSIDASSKQIIIRLKESGLREIKVIDDGSGMSKNDASLAFERHATSKLITDDDLFSIKTLGFRGEALPSIASVSEVVLKTCNGKESTLVHIKGGKVIETISSDEKKGTIITITNLFYNTPARLKHLSSVYNELASIISYVNKIALSYPNIKFRLINDEKEMINTDGSDNLLKVIKKIYGLDITKKMVEINGFNDDYNVWGYVSLPEVTRSNRSHIITIVNGRVVRNNELNKVINEAYHTYKEDSRYPIVVLKIDTDPTIIDVNIHPSKMDIKFGNFDELKTLIIKVIRKAISNKVLIPKIEIKKEIELKTDDTFYNNSFVVKEESIGYQMKLDDNISNNDYVEAIKDNVKLPTLFPVGVVFGTYIVCQNEKGLYLIDQHAAKERINYEYYSKVMYDNNNNISTLIVPINIELPKNECLIIKKNINILNNMGIAIEEFGTTSFIIKEHPAWIRSDEAEDVIRKILDLIIRYENNFDVKRFNDRLAMTISCKKSKKANEYSSISEMESLIADLQLCDNPYHCPHGRPTIITFTKYELEKMFKRSI
ncbi:MAG: DNA mismatch repair endonuclease MutL [bacterium]|nr:DNA mismatch repair endonuclease MutL [bacterium]